MILPSSSISISYAAGLFGRPGIVKIFWVRATIKPAPWFNLISFIVISYSLSGFKFVGSSDKEYWVLAIHISNLSEFKLLILLISFKAFFEYFTPLAL